MQQLIEITGDVKIGHALNIHGSINYGSPIIVTGNIIVGFDIEHQTYEGEYEITPKVYEQILETGNMLMADDVTVREITYTLTSNEKGLTAQIGEV